MLIIMLTNLRRDGHTFKAGDEVLIPNRDAFVLVKDGHAKPATRQAHRTYHTMLEDDKALNLHQQAGPDIRDQFVSAPKVQNTLQAQMGRITAGNRTN